MKCAVLITLCRRYYELEQNLWYIRTHLFRELDEIPNIVLVWAQPEQSKRDFVEALGLTHVIYRDKMPLESEANTSYPESHNIRRGLEFIRDNVACDYVIFQTADAFIKEGAYGTINAKMKEDQTRVVGIKWPHQVYRHDAKCTNFFAIKTEGLESYWPPISDPESFHTLEMQWLIGTQLPGIIVLPEWQNYFYHDHELSKLNEYLRSRDEAWKAKISTNRFFIGPSLPKLLERYNDATHTK